MSVHIVPKSIRGKLVVGVLVVVGPMMVVQFGEYASAYLRSDGAVLSHGDKAWFAWTIAACIFGLAIALILGNSLSRPIRRLAHAASAMAVGDFRKRVSVRTGDELEVLGDAFNGLGESLIGHEAALKGQAELLAGMVEAARVASSSLDLRQCGKSIAKEMCENMGASGSAVFIRDEVNGGLRIVGRSGSHDNESWKRVASHASDSGGYLVMTEHLAESEADTLADVFLVGIPLWSGSGSVGAIVARFDDGVTRDDLGLGNVKADILTAFGIHAAAAIKNAEVYSETEKYSAVLEDWVEHLSAVMQVTNAISPSLTLDETLAALSSATATVLKADVCNILLLDRDGYLVIKSCSSPDLQVVSGMRLRPGESVSGRAFAEMRPISCRDALRHGDKTGKGYAGLTGMRAVLSTPLIVEDRPIGTLTIYDKAPRKFSEQEIRLLTSIALHAAVLVRNASLYTREYSIAETLQQGLLSEIPSECGGLRFASRYIPALDEARVGGDFYDVTLLPNGAVGLVIGDVSGKGLQAAIHLAACKYMIKALMYAHPDDPGLVLSELNSAINHYFDMSFFVTVFYAIVDPDRATITYASAGHPPALLIRQEGKMHSCLPNTGIPVGSGQECDYETRRACIDPSDILLLYTDGVTDAVLDGGQLGVEGLNALVFDAGRCSASELVSFICQRLQNSPGSSLKDDVALLAISFEEMHARTVIVDGGSDECKYLATHAA